MYLLDTNVISELRKPKPHGGVLAWVDGLANHELFLSAVTLGELQAGVELTRRQDAAKAEEIEKWIDQMADGYQVLSMDGRCFREWARLLEGHPDRLSEDAMLAATARMHGLTVVTRNTRDFQAFGVKLLNPFTARSTPR
jgi:predicted nucleic acid-binding protein